MIFSRRGGARIKIKTFLVLGLLAFLGACSEYEQVNKTVDKNEQTIDRAFQSLMPKQKTVAPLVVDDRPWFGSNAIPMLNGSPLPVAYQRRNALVLTFTGPVSLARATQMIQSVTGIRVQIGQTVLGNGPRAQEEANNLFLPVDAEQVTGGRFVWQGRLSDLLNQLSDHFGSDWSYDGRLIRFSSEVTRTFMLHALATELNTSDDLSGNDAEGSSLPGMSLDSSISIDIWGEIEDAVNSIVGRQGEAVFSPSTGTITVTGNPEVVRRVESYLNKQNEMRLRRVAVAIKVLDVTLTNSYSVGASVDGVLSHIFESAGGGAVINAAGGGVFTIRRNNPKAASFSAAAASDSILSTLELSELVERVSIAHAGSVVTLSDQPAPLQVGRQIAYLARVSAVGGDTTGQLSLEPDSVTEGLTMLVVPRILDRNRILMRLSVSVIDAQEPFAQFGSGDLQIQLPEIATTGFLQNALMNTGETMVLAGFERKQDSYSDEGMPGGLWTGGTRSTDRSRNITVLLLTAEILPEYNMTVINQ